MRILLIALLAWSCSSSPQLPYYHRPDFTPLWAEEQSFGRDTLHRIADFSFTDQAGRMLTRRDLDGKVYVANFFFTACPGICPKMTDGLSRVQQRFSKNDNVMIVSHSVMPWADSVARLNAYAELHEVNYEKWRLLTGRQSEIYTLARQSYFAEEVAGFNRDSTDFVHTEHCILVDGDGFIRGLYNGTIQLEIDRLIEDIAVLAE